MLAVSPRNGSICTRCAFRLRLLALQQQRRPKTAYALNDDNSVNSTPPFRYARSTIGRDTRRDGDGNRRRNNTAHQESWFFGKETVQKHLDLSGKRGIGVRPKENFRDVLMNRLDKIKDEVKDAPVLEQLAKDRQDMDGKKEESFSKLWKNFVQMILQSERGKKLPFMGELMPDNKSGIWDDLLSVWKGRGLTALDDRIKYNFYGHVTNSRFTESDIKNQVALADLRYPSEWFPATRQMQRTIHLHVGPTNSGKTYQALKRLEEAERGVYAGPLRLLAHEVYTRMNAKGRRCILVTGEERRRPQGEHVGDDGNYELTSCTVEMVPLNNTVDVAVIDEIQMIGSTDRGWAWTQAVLGVQAREVHLCGEARTVPLIKELCASVGEKLVVHEYKRLSPLKVSHQALDGDLRKLRKGDCIVSFSVMGIHALRREIEKSTGKKVAIVYGSLPPETRAQQARLFNDPNNDYDYLVASDAVGMGLNLAIKRIIFETSSKFDGTARRTLSIADIKQIGGRAGRFRTAAQATEGDVSQQDLAAAKGDTDPEAAHTEDDTPENVGLVTTLERFDFPIVAAAMDAEPEPIQSAGLFPPSAVLERFSSYFPPGTPFSYMLTRLHELSQMHKRFHLCGLKDQIWLADIIEPVEGLTVTDRNNICSAPASKSDFDLWNALLPAYARIIANQTSGSLIDIQELPLEILEADVTNDRDYLRELERLHKGIVTYLWLSYRFPGVFTTRPLALHVKSLVEEKIEHVLGQISFSETQRKKLAKAREKQLMKELLLEQQQEELREQEHEAAAAAAPVGPSTELLDDDDGDQAEDLDAADEGIDHALAELAEEEPSSENDGVSQYREPEIGEELQGTSPRLESIETASNVTAQEIPQIDGQLSSQAASEISIQASEQGANIDDRLPPTTTPEQAEDGAFSGEQYLELEEEPEVEEKREAESDVEKGADTVRSEEESIDPELIIQELTRHEGDIPRKPDEPAKKDM